MRKAGALSFLLIFLSKSTIAVCQSPTIDETPRKGSYLYFRQPAFEDNSFLIDEAFTQEKGVLQHRSTFYLDNLHGGNFVYSFSQEIPITHLRHQINYTIYYNVLNANAGGSGFGDLDIGYRFMALGKKDWAMVVPGFTLILPTGNATYGNGSGGVGGRLSVAVTKRLSNRLVTHYNAGYTYIFKADRFVSN